VSSNWGGTAPVASDDLVFPAGAANPTNTNDFPAGTPFHSITYSGGTYVAGGNLLVIGSGGLNSTADTTLSMPLALAAPQTWTVGIVLKVDGTLDLAGNALALHRDASPLTMGAHFRGAILNPAGITIDGGFWDFASTSVSPNLAINAGNAQLFVIFRPRRHRPA